MKKLLVLISTIICFSSAQAGMVSTQDVYLEQMRSQLSLQLSQPELIEAMKAAGITQEQATHRLEQLTPAELSQISHQLNDLPAGGTDFVGFLLTVFAILVVTDALGYTDIFPFVTKPE